MSDPSVRDSNAELADLLDAYAEARLAPRSAVLGRIRDDVLARARVAVAPAVQPLEEELPRPVVLARPWRRRFAALGLAAALTVGSGAAVFAAPPGSPLYSTRVWIETLALPAGGDARSDGHAHLLQQRIREAQDAAAHGDAGAVAAAIAAYDAEVQAALADAGNDVDRLSRLEAELGRHLAVLQALQALVPTQAADAVNRAIDASSKAVKNAQDKSKNPGARPTQRPTRP